MHLINKFPSTCSMALFSRKISIVSLVLTDYGFVLPYVHFVHLAFLKARLSLAKF